MEFVAGVILLILWEKVPRKILQNYSLKAMATTRIDSTMVRCDMALLFVT